ncbi:MAG: AMP-binding protein [Puniceicoccaceae bacterium]
MKLPSAMETLGYEDLLGGAEPIRLDGVAQLGDGLGNYWRKVLAHLWAGKEVLLGGAGEVPLMGNSFLGGLPTEDVFLEELGRREARIGIYSSGTTGKPRLIWQSLGRILPAVRRAPDYQGQLWAHSYNPCHLAGLLVAMQVFLTRSRMVDLREVELAEVPEAFESAGLDRISVTPTFFRGVPWRKGWTCERIVSCTFGGERVGKEDLEQARTLFPRARVRNLFASTEGGVLMGSETEVFEIDGVDWVRVREGCLEVRSDYVAEWEGRELTEDGWYRTGDQVKELEGPPRAIRFVGRSSGRINVGGLWVDPEEVEAKIRSWRGVTMAFVYGVPNRMTGSVLAAKWMGNADEVCEKELRRFLANELPREAVPRIFEQVDRLPVLASGKVDRLAASGRSHPVEEGVGC